MEIRPDRTHVAPQRPLDQDLPSGGGEEIRYATGSQTFDLFSTFAFSLARFGILGLFLAFVLGTGGIATWVIRGAGPVREAARATNTAEEAWFASLNGTQPIIRELTGMGAPREELETVYFAYIDARRSYKAEQADVLLQVMQDQAVAVRGIGHDVSRVMKMLEPVMRSRVAVTDAYSAWLDTTQQPSARLAIAFGMAPLPGPRLVQYEEMPRMIRTVSGGAP